MTVPGLHRVTSAATGKSRLIWVHNLAATTIRFQEVDADGQRRGGHCGGPTSAWFISIEPADD